MPTILLMLLLFAPLAAVAQVGTAADCDRPASTNDGWQVAAPSDVGLDPAVLCRVGPRFSAWKQAGIHAVLVVRHGKLTYEHYFTNPDERYGQLIGNVAYDASMKHDLRSITKSVTALVLGIAIGKGQIASERGPAVRQSW